MLVIAHSHFSYHYGVLSPEMLAERMAEQGHEVGVLTDINNTAGHSEWVKACRKNRIEPVTGISFRNGNALCYIGLPFDQEGVRELNAHLTHYELAGIPFPEHPPPFYHASIILPFHKINERKGFRENEWIGVAPGDLRWKDRSTIRSMEHRCVAFHPGTFMDEAEHRDHLVLRAVHHNSNLHCLEPDQYAPVDEKFRTPDEIKGIYHQVPGLLKNAEWLLSQCTHLNIEPGGRNRQTYSGTHSEDCEMLRKLAWDAFGQRYGPTNKVARERLNKELAMIGRLDLAGYFLITHDIVEYAHSRGYHHVGRGSGANSIVAYCLGITDVDPVDLNLYFERFINPERTSPPDFDIDFSWDQRDDVTRYVLERFGPSYTALLGTFDTFNRRSSIREVGKVHGLPDGEIDPLINAVERGQKVSTRHARGILKQADRLIGIPDHLGIHAGGILIGEAPLAYSTAMERPPKGFPVAQLDMHVAEEMGFHKFDVLSQRGLGHIKEAADIIRKNRSKEVDVREVDRFKKDEKSRDLLKKGQCIGCFYIESPAMRGLLQKLECSDHRSLVAASSIIRPGVSQSGMMREYIRRARNPERFQYLHPVFREHLSETYGVMVYQEDVIKVLHEFAGLDLSEADVLRKIMSGKPDREDRLAGIREKFFANCQKLGREKTVSEEVWRQIESFSGYAFAKGHSASYAVESFQSLYLKAHYPKEFLVAVINNFGGFYRTGIYVQEARKNGARIHPPCINNSDHLTTIKGDDIYLGFVHMHGLERELVRSMLTERERNGPYGSLEGFVERVPDVKKEQLELLIRIGAFRSTGRSRKELMWEQHGVLSCAPAQTTQWLFDRSLPAVNAQLPVLEDSEVEVAHEEINILGFPLCSPFDLLRVRSRGDAWAADLKVHAGRTVRIVGYFVTVKPVRTKNGERMGFGTWLDGQGDFFDTVHFPRAYRRYPFRGIGCYLIRGKVEVDHGFPSIEVDRMELLEWK